ncbi:ankyrin repeat domain-containing protein [Vibrio mediterranei]|uniref:ankyrin repeat domain-containing protein n=1 Tax=Vibrio mediterranei TaxID=689 RepID=UPI001E4A66C7|nr:ankyrin repeat domain-containing protein [Vibrio mediterranei]
MNVQTDTGFSPLMIASREGYIDIVKLLVEFGANKELETKKGNSARNIAFSRAPKNKYGRVDSRVYQEIIALLAPTEKSINAT